MAKHFRFSELIKQSGRPETMTLWSKPANNPGLQQAIRQNRILTIIQKPTSKGKDFALVGFHEEKFASYLIFPKRLPKMDADAVVIGIRYDLIENKGPALGLETRPRRNGHDANGKPSVQTVRRSTQERPTVALTKPEKLAAETKRFRVVVSRTATIRDEIIVNASTISQAETLAREQAKQLKFAPGKVEIEIEAINKMN
jgi:hypothetical protein